MNWLMEKIFKILLIYILLLLEYDVILNFVIINRSFITFHKDKNRSVFTLIIL